MAYGWCSVSWRESESRGVAILCGQLWPDAIPLTTCSYTDPLDLLRETSTAILRRSLVLCTCYVLQLLYGTISLCGLRGQRCVKQNERLFFWMYRQN